MFAQIQAGGFKLRKTETKEKNTLPDLSLEKGGKAAEEAEAAVPPQVAAGGAAAGADVSTMRRELEALRGTVGDARKRAEEAEQQIAKVAAEAESQRKAAQQALAAAVAEQQRATQDAVQQAAARAERAAGELARRAEAAAEKAIGEAVTKAVASKHAQEVQEVQDITDSTERRAEDAERRCADAAAAARETRRRVQALRVQLDADREARLRIEQEARSAELLAAQRDDDSRAALTREHDQQQAVLSELQSQVACIEARLAAAIREGLTESLRGAGQAAADAAAAELRGERQDGRPAALSAREGAQAEADARVRREQLDYERRERLLARRIAAAFESSAAALRRQELRDREFDERREAEQRAALRAAEQRARGAVAASPQRAPGARALLPPQHQAPAPAPAAGEVTAWLAGIGMEHYAGVFAANEFDICAIAALSEADLDAMGITALGARKRLLLAAQQLPRPAGAAPAPCPFASTPPPPLAPRAAEYLQQPAQSGALPAPAPPAPQSEAAAQRALVAKEVAAEWAAQRQREVLGAESDADYTRIAEWDEAWQRAGEADDAAALQEQRLVRMGWSPPAKQQGTLPGSWRTQVLLDRLAGHAPPSFGPEPYQ